jgi:hypothetical protein
MLDGSALSTADGKAEGSGERILVPSSDGLLVSDDYVARFEVFDDSMEVSEMDATTCKIAAHFIVNAGSIMNWFMIAL